MKFRVEFGAARSACRSCGDEVVWIETAGGKRMPLSFKTREPDESNRAPDGTVTGWLMDSHFADCPNASKHRKARA